MFGVRGDGWGKTRTGWARHGQARQDTGGPGKTRAESGRQGSRGPRRSEPARSSSSVFNIPSTCGGNCGIRDLGGRTDVSAGLYGLQQAGGVRGAGRGGGSERVGGAGEPSSHSPCEVVIVMFCAAGAIVFCDLAIIALRRQKTVALRASPGTRREMPGDDKTNTNKPKTQRGYYGNNKKRGAAHLPIAHKCVCLPDLRVCTNWSCTRPANCTSLVGGAPL